VESSSIGRPCPVCCGEQRPLFAGVILHRYDVQYYRCDACGLLQTEKPFWLNEAYDSAIADSDTGLVNRNISCAKKISSLLYLMGLSDKRLLDCAGGTGMFVRLMRDIGFDAFWQDPYCDNVHARGFSYSDHMQGITAVTAFEVLEHLEDPVAFIRESLDRSGADSFIFSTELYPSEQPPALDAWWYYACQTGQHISFYHLRTLEKLASLLGMQLYSHGCYHMFTRRQFSAWQFRLATGRFSALLAPLVKYTMHSRMMQDNQLILNRAAATKADEHGT